MRLVAMHAAVGYQTPGQRSGCRSCKHIAEICVPYCAPRWQCDLHHLEVTSGGICPDYFARSTQGCAMRYGHRDLFTPQHGESRS